MMDGKPQLHATLDRVFDEVQRAVAKHGEQHDLTDSEWLAVVVEELGESSHHISERLLGNKVDERELDVELIQTAAMVVRWMTERLYARARHRADAEHTAEVEGYGPR